MLALAPLLALSLVPPAADHSGELALGVASALAKLRPGDAVPPGRAIDLAAARGECESAQVAVRASRRLGAFSAEAGPLLGPRPLEVALYRVATLPFARGSGPDGAPGEWPDPLIPVRDPWFRERRSAFPAEVAPGRLEAVWIEVCVPPSAQAGVYRGAVVLREGERKLGEVPVAVRVWPFAIPATGAFGAAYGLSTRLGTRALGAPDDREVARALAAAALRHRVTPFVLSADPPDGACTASACDLDWRAYDAEVAPILGGTLVPGVRGAFAEVRIAGPVWSGPEADLLAALRAWRRHFTERGWADRLWLYTLDEPSPSAIPELARRARLARQAGIPVLVTAAPSPALEGIADLLVPNLTLVPDRGPRPPRVGWSYASCLSHGCAEMPAEGPRRTAFAFEFGGWPGYEVDRPATAARAVQWLAWRRGLSGELYYDMLQAWQGDPWRDVRAFAGNGDGTLLYPGLPARLGGTRPFPVESIRLKTIRDGLEDLELLRLATERGQGALARRLAARLVPAGRRWERDPDAWLSAHRQLGEAIAKSPRAASR